MQTTRRKFVGGAASLGLGVASPAIAQTRTIRLGDTAALAMSWPLFIAEQKGFFREEGIALETTYTNSNPAVAQQVVGGNFDIGVTTYETGVRAIVGAAPLQIVGTIMRAFPYIIMARPEVQSPADMRGKTIILTLAKSILTVFWNRWLIENNMKPEDVDQIYDPATPNRFAALKSKSVQAAVLSQPFDWIAAEDGFVKLLDLGARVRDYGFTAFVVREDWASKNSELLRGFLRATSKGVAFFSDAANREACADILAPPTKMEKANALRTFDYYTKELHPFEKSLDLPNRQLELLIGTLIEMGDFKAGDDYRPARFVNPSFLPK